MGGNNICGVGCRRMRGGDGVTNGNYRKQVIDLLDKQDAKGMSKYGCPLEQSKAEIAEKLNHLAEELVDGLRYVLWVMAELQSSDRTHANKIIIRNCGNCGWYSEKNRNCESPIHCHGPIFANWKPGGLIE